MSLPPPLDSEAFVKDVVTTLVTTPGVKVLTAYDGDLFSHVPVVLAMVLPGPVTDEGQLETLTVDVDVVTLDRASSVRISLDLMRALNCAWQQQTVFTRGHLADFAILSRPFRSDVTGSVDSTRRLGDPKGTVRHSARYVLTVRPS